MSSLSKSEPQGGPRNKHFYTVDMPVYEGDPKESSFQKKWKQHLEYSQDTKTFFYILVMILNTKTHSSTYDLLKRKPT